MKSPAMPCIFIIFLLLGLEQLYSADGRGAAALVDAERRSSSAEEDAVALVVGDTPDAITVGEAVITKRPRADGMTEEDEAILAEWLKDCVIIDPSTAEYIPSVEMKKETSGAGYTATIIKAVAAAGVVCLVEAAATTVSQTAGLVIQSGTYHASRGIIYLTLFAITGAVITVTITLDGIIKWCFQEKKPS